MALFMGFLVFFIVVIVVGLIVTGRPSPTPAPAAAEAATASAEDEDEPDTAGAEAEPEPEPAAATTPRTTTPAPRISTTTPSTIRRSTTTEGWWSGGNLHNSLSQQWRRGSADNRLATAADYVVVRMGRDEAVALAREHGGSMDALKPYAREIVRCLDEAVADAAMVDIKMSGLATTCWKLI